MAIGRPRRDVNGHSKTAMCKRDCCKNKSLHMDVCDGKGMSTFGVGLVKLDIRRDDLLLQRKNGFNHRAETCCPLGMA